MSDEDRGEMEGHCQKGHVGLQDESNGPLTERNGKVSARPATPHRETAVKGDEFLSSTSV